KRELSFRGPAPILLLIGVILLVFSALRQWRGPNVPAGVLLGPGAAVPPPDPLRPGPPRRALLLLRPRAGRPPPAGAPRGGARAPGIVLVLIAACAIVSENLRVPEALAETLWRLWPWAIVAAGAVLVVRALAVRRAP